MAEPFNVLFLCTGNSARSILTEAALNLPSIGGGRFRGFSAGSHPAGRVNPFAIELLREQHISTDGLRSKSWDEFSAPDAPHMHFIFTVCDNAAGDVCPIWPGHPVTAHWGVPDPAAVAGSDEDKRRAFRDAWRVLSRRAMRFAALPISSLSTPALQEQIDRIGRDA